MKALHISLIAALLAVGAPPLLQAQNSPDRFKEWDTNSDGTLSEDELPEPARSRFRRLDVNQDGFLTRDEMESMIQTRRIDPPQRDPPTVPTPRIVSAGPPMADTPLGRIVGQVDPSLGHDAWNDPALIQRVSEEAVAHRKRMLIDAGAADEFHRRGAKHMFPIVLARLQLDPADREALDYLPQGMIERSHSDFFGKSALARIWCQFGSLLSPQVAADLRNEVAGYENYLTGGTENHIAMKRSAGILFGEQFPDDMFAGGKSGREVSDSCREYLRAYGRDIYAVSMNEFLSPTYHGVNTAPWLNVAEFARDDSTRLMAAAVLDWMFADLALNYNHGLITPPFQRANGYLADSYQLAYARTQTAWTAWLYFGGGLTPDAPGAKFSSDKYKPMQPYGMAGVLHAMSPYLPDPVIRNIGAKRIESPFMTWQARVIRDGSVAQLRSTYATRNYAIGTGYFAEDVSLRFTQPFAVSWKSKDERNYLMAQHPYWFTGGAQSGRPERDEKASVPQSDGEDWIGVSPFCQSVHWENAAVLLYDIPATDPYSATHFNDRGAAIQGGRTPTVNQSVFIYVPESMDERLQVSEVFFFREGDVYIALSPLCAGAAWKPTVKEGYVRLELPAVDHLTGFAIEVGDRTEFESFEKFQASAAASALDLTKLNSNKEVTFTSTRGDRLHLQHQPVPNAEATWLPTASVNGEALDFANWPVCQSPFVTCVDRVLDINDGHSGVTIDWSGDLPEYTYFDLVDGKRVTTRNKSIQNGKLVMTSTR